MSYGGCVLFAILTLIVWTVCDELHHLIADLGRWLVSVS